MLTPKVTEITRAGHSWVHAPTQQPGTARPLAAAH
jgi:hypothetical protein